MFNLSAWNMRSCKIISLFNFTINKSLKKRKIQAWYFIFSFRYLQCFDLEAECGIVVRGLGTAVSLVRLQEPSHAMPCQYAEEWVDLTSVETIKYTIIYQSNVTFVQDKCISKREPLKWVFNTLKAFWNHSKAFHLKF